MRTGNLVLGMLLVLLALGALTWSVSGCEQAVERSKDGVSYVVATACRDSRPFGSLGLPLLGLGLVSLALVPLGRRSAVATLDRRKLDPYLLTRNPAMIVLLRRLPSGYNKR